MHYGTTIGSISKNFYDINAHSTDVFYQVSDLVNTTSKLNPNTL